MKLAARCGFLALIALCLAIEATHGRDGGIDSGPLAGLARGLQRLSVETDPSPGAGVLIGKSRSCRQPIHAMLLHIDGANSERLDGLPRDDDEVSYIYLGSVGQNWDKAAMIRRSFWAGLQFAVGLRSSRPPTDLVAVLLPRACPELANLSWKDLSPRD